MRFVGWVVLGLVVACSLTGCMGVSKEDVAMIRDTRNQMIDIGIKRYESIEELRDEIRNVWKQVDAQKEIVMDKWEAGTITLAEAEAFKDSIEIEGDRLVKRLDAEMAMTKDDFDTQLTLANKTIAELDAKQYKWWQKLGAFLSTFGAGLLIDRKKLIGV